MEINFDLIVGNKKIIILEERFKSNYNEGPNHRAKYLIKKIAGGNAKSLTFIYSKDLLKLISENSNEKYGHIILGNYKDVGRENILNITKKLGIKKNKIIYLKLENNFRNYVKNLVEKIGLGIKIKEKKRKDTKNIEDSLYFTRMFSLENLDVPSNELPDKEWGVKDEKKERQEKKTLEHLTDYFINQVNLESKPTYTQSRK